MNIKKLIRLNDWKNYIIPFLSGAIFVSVYIYETPFIHALKVTGLLLVSIIGTAAYGYLLNNLYDLEEDRRAGKINFAENLSGLAKVSLGIIFLAIALFPWLFLPVSLLNFGLFILQLVLLTAYCIPPVRLKRFIYAGVITDALYNSVIMVFVIVFTIGKDAEIVPKNGNLILISLFTVLFLKGLRGILLHQLSDRKNDRKAGIKTFVSCYGPLSTNYIVSKIVLPLEFAIMTILIVLLSGIIPGFILLYLGFLIYVALKYRLWNFRWIPIKKYLFYFRFILNDFYEQWTPMYMLILLAITEVSFILLLILFLFLFPKLLFNLYKEIPEAYDILCSNFQRKLLIKRIWLK